MAEQHTAPVSEDPRCPICSGKSTPLQTGGRYQLRRCNDCDFGFTWPPMPSEEHLQFHGPQFFRRYYEQSVDDFYANEGPLFHRERAKKLWNLAFFSRYVPAGKILDIGTGQGMFSYLARDRGYQVSVIEICPPVVDYHQRHGLEVHQCYVEDAKIPDASLDGVSMWHTLEHMFDAVSTLRQVYRILKPGGYLVGAIPNWNGLGTRLRLAVKHPLLDPETDHELHFSFFSPVALRRAMRQAGLIPVRIGVEWTRPRRLRDKLVHRTGQLLSIVTGQNLRETMMFVARKPLHDQGLPERSFVKHRNDDVGSKAVDIRRVLGPQTPAEVSVIIPTADGDRNGRLPALLEQLKEQTLEHFEVLVAAGDMRQGRAINCAVAQSQGEILVTLDDDTRLGSSDTLRLLVDCLRGDPSIGMAGGANRPSAADGWLVSRVMEELPRRSSPEVSQPTDSDMAEHPCLAIRKDAFLKVGGENEWIPRGLDPYLRAEFRQAGYRVVVVPGVVYHHLPPGDIVGLGRQFFRNGAQSRYCSRCFPQWCYDTGEHHTDIPGLSSLPVRLARALANLGRAVAQGQFAYLFCRLAYGLGWLSEELRGRLGLDEEEV